MDYQEKHKKLLTDVNKSTAFLISKRTETKPY